MFKYISNARNNLQVIEVEKFKKIPQMGQQIPYSKGVTMRAILSNPAG